MCQIIYWLQGEAFNTADPELVVCALAGKSRHIHKEVLGLRSSPGGRLAQCSAHMIVWIFPLIAKEMKCTFIQNFISISYLKIYCSSLRCIWKLYVKKSDSTPITCGSQTKKPKVTALTTIKITTNPSFPRRAKKKTFSEWGSEIPRLI